MADKKRKKGSTKKGTKSKVISVDFSKDEGGRRRYPEGDYAVKFIGWKTGESSDKGTPYVRVRLEFTEGKFKGSKISDDLYLTDKATWRIRSFLEAMGVDIPKKKVNVNFDKYKGNELGITLTDDEFEGRIRSRVSDYIDLDTLRGADEEDEDEDDEDEDDEDENEEDEDEEDEDEDEDDDEEDMEEFDDDDL